MTWVQAVMLLHAARVRGPFPVLRMVWPVLRQEFWGWPVGCGSGTGSQPGVLPFPGFATPWLCDVVLLTFMLSPVPHARGTVPVQG